MIAIVNYGVGNLFSLSSSLKYLGLDAIITDKAEDLKSADRIILPGVGAFGDAIDKLNATGLVPTLINEARRSKPLLGICLGMQLLFDESFENGHFQGLGLIEGVVFPLQNDLPSFSGLKVPQMGWNALGIIHKDNPLMKYSKDGDMVYYVHSYYAKCCERSTVAVSEYGVLVPGVVANGKIFGCQFHPEKSGEVGLRILRAFSEV